MSQTGLRGRYERFLNYGNTYTAERSRSLECLREMVLLNGIPPLTEEELSMVKEGTGCSLRGTLWKIFLGVKDINPQQYIALVKNGPAVCRRSIDNDVGRTFRHDSSFEDVVSRDKLYRCLNAFAHICPEIGYVQGMNVLCGTFLYVLPEIEAFYCFYNLMKYRLEQYVIQDLPGAHAALELLTQILKATDPELHAYLHAHSFKPQFLLHAILSLGSGTPPLTEVLKLWDLYLAFGVHMNVVCTVAQLILMRNILLKHPSPCSLLRVLPQLDAAAIISISVRLVQQLPAPLYEMLVQHATVANAVVSGELNQLATE